MRVHFRFSRRRTHCDFVQLAQEFWGTVGDPGSNPSVFAGLVPASRHTGCDLQAKRAVNEYGRDGRFPLLIRPDLPEQDFWPASKGVRPAHTFKVARYSFEVS